MATPTSGILVLDSRFDLDAFVDGAGTYTEAGPQPGVPVPGDTGSPWLPEIVGAQSADIDIQALRGGFPGRDGASIKWRVDGDAATEWRGWDEPNLVTNCTAPSTEWSTFNFSVGAIAAIPSTGEIVVYVDGTSGSHVFRYNPRSEEWTAGADLAASSISLVAEHVALVWDAAREQLILYTGEGDFDEECVALRSTDKGDTWSIYSIAYMDADTLSDLRMSVVPFASGSWAAATGNGDLTQWTSPDNGVTWEIVGTAISSAINTDQFELVPTRAGGMVIVYIEDTTNDLKSRSLASSQSLFSDSSAVTLDSGAFAAMAACTDEDGIIYVIALETAETDLMMWRSLDDGLTWEQYTYAIGADLFGDAPGQVPELRMCASNGQLHVLCVGSSVFSSQLTAPFFLITLGGWSNVEADVSSGQPSTRIQRVGYGANSPSSDGTLWLPCELPYSPVGIWAQNGATGMDLSQGPFGRVATTSASEYFSLTHTHVDYVCGEFKIKVNSGGSTGSNDICLRARVADGTRDFRLAIRLTTTDIAAYDVHGAVGATAGGLDLTDPVYIRWHIVSSAGTAYAFVAYRFEADDTYTIVTESTSLTADLATPAANNSIEWGNIASSTASSDWYFVGYAPGGSWRYGVRTPSGVNTTIVANSGDPLGLQYGHPVPSRADGAYPIPGATTSAQDMGRISASGGPCYVSEATDIPAAHDYPASAVIPVHSPRPSAYWESTDTTEATLTWDLGAIAWPGAALGLVVMGGYGRQWILERSTNGTTWNTEATLDLAIGTSLSATRSGIVFRPRSGTTDVAQYIPENSLVGGYVISTNAGPAAFRIIRNSGGYWTDDADVQAVRLEVEGSPSGGASDTVDVVAPNGVHIDYITSVTSRRYWRVRVAASQVTPGSVYRAGIVGIGRVVGLGAVHDWDWSRSLQTHVLSQVDPDGYRDVAEQGDPTQAWTWSWNSGLMLKTLRDSSYPDSIKVSGGLELGSAEDPWGTLWGLLQGPLKSGEVPCVLLPRLPSSSGDITDPTLFRYGRLLSVGDVSGVAGTEGTDEHVRLGPMRFEELR